MGTAARVRRRLRRARLPELPRHRVPARDDPAEVRAGRSKSAQQGWAARPATGRTWSGSRTTVSTADQARRWRLNERPRRRAAKFGMTDLRDPATRAEVCSSCHVGNAGEGKVVTHAMYAAGHPPLPGFEVATFLDAMPPHWAKPDETSTAVPEGPGARGHGTTSTSRSRQATRSVVIGGVVALRDAMRLLAGARRARTGAAGARRKAGPTTPSSSATPATTTSSPRDTDAGRQARGFDHHFDGLVVARRPRVGPSSAPGRWRWRGSPSCRPARQGRDDYRDAVKDLYAAFDARPFGDPAASPARRSGWRTGRTRCSGRSSRPVSTPSRRAKLLAVLAATPAAEVSDLRLGPAGRLGLPGDLFRLATQARERRPDRRGPRGAGQDPQAQPVRRAASPGLA